MALSYVIPVWIEQVTSSYEQDQCCLDMIQKLSIDPAAIPNYTLSNGLLRCKNKLVIGNSGTLRKQLLDSFHQSSFGGHSGERATLKRLQLVFQRSKMQQMVKEYVSNYPICQKNKSEHVPYFGLLQPLPIPDMAWTHISMDFVEGLPKSRGKDVILVVVDRFTKYAHFISLTHPYTTQDIATIFLDYMVCPRSY